MNDDILEEFYSDINSDNNLKLLIEFKNSKYNYKGSFFDIPQNEKKIKKAKEFNIKKKPNNKNLF